MMTFNHDIITTGGTVSIIIRHAERDDIKDMRDPFSALLTEKGRHDARTLGATWPASIPAHFLCSPAPRCIETAQFLQKGIAEGGGVFVDHGHIFELNGPYVKKDWTGIAEIVNNIGHAAFMRQWFDGHVPEDVLMPLHEAATMQLNILVEQLNQNQGSYINVSHDWNIMLILEYFLNIRHEDADQPGFLEGITAVINGTHLDLYYRDEMIDVPLKEIRAFY